MTSDLYEKQLYKPGRRESLYDLSTPQQSHRPIFKYHPFSALLEFVSCNKVPKLRIDIERRQNESDVPVSKIPPQMFPSSNHKPSSGVVPFASQHGKISWLPGVVSGS